MSVEKAGSHVFGMLALWGTQRAGRTVSVPGAPSVTQSFALRWTVLATAGWVFESEAAVALFATAFNEGDPTINGARDPAGGRRLTTVGAAGRCRSRPRGGCRGRRSPTSRSPRWAATSPPAPAAHYRWSASGTDGARPRSKPIIRARCDSGRA